MENSSSAEKTPSFSKVLNQKVVVLAALIGAAQGLVGWSVDELWPGRNDEFTSFFTERYTLLAVLYFVFAGGLCAQLLLKNSLGIREWGMAIGTGLLFGLITCWSLYQLVVVLGKSRLYGSDGGHLFEIFLFFLLLAYVLIPYLQAWHGRIDGHFQYHDLYRHSWDNFFIVSVGLLLAGVYWLLIVLWVSLFKILNIEIFADIFFSSSFAWITIMAVIGVGITIGINNEKVIGTLRNIALAICKLLMPLTAVITILFTATLPFVGLQPIWNTNQSTPILIALIATNVLFVNGIIQDAFEVKYPDILKKLVNISLFMIPILAVIAAYSTWLRIDQHGLTPHRIYSSLIILIAFCYSFSYPWAVLKSQSQWLEKVRTPNIYTGFLICVLIVLTHSPVLDPLKLSASNQYNRLIEKKVEVDKFDFGTLHYKWGKPGQYYLQKIRDLEEHPALDEISDGLALLDKTNGYYEWQRHLKKTVTLNRKKIKVLSVPSRGISSDREIPDSFYIALKPNDCQKSCYLLFLDLDGDAQEEILKFTSLSRPYSVAVYGLKGDVWVRLGRYDRIGRTDKKIDQHLNETGVELIDQKYKNLSIGDSEWDFR